MKNNLAVVGSTVICEVSA